MQCDPTPTTQWNLSFPWKEAMPFPQATSQTAELSSCGATVVFLFSFQYVCSHWKRRFSSFFFSCSKRSRLFLAHISSFELAFGHKVNTASKDVCLINDRQGRGNRVTVVCNPCTKCNAPCSENNLGTKIRTSGKLGIWSLQLFHLTLETCI